MKDINKQVIILVDSFNNTLGLIRSLGEAQIDIILILVGENDRLFVTKSKYLNKKQIFQISHLENSLDILNKIYNPSIKQYLICTNDKAALFIDGLETELSKRFITPMRGKQLGSLFDKDTQCKLAIECGLTVPQSTVYHLGESFPECMTYPLLLKPLNSNVGEKSDIHICKDKNEVMNCLSTQSQCTSFIVQEFIDKEYELNLLGIRTSTGTYIAGGIEKIRHYPLIYSPCSFGVFHPIQELHITTAPIEKFMNEVGYYGPFSVELLHKGDKNYFMEVNFRHDGLGYAATAAHCNLLHMYINETSTLDKAQKIYMMDLSIDYCHVKDNNIRFYNWFLDFMHTSCQLNFNRKDPLPTIEYYLHKFKSKLHL